MKRPRRLVSAALVLTALVVVATLVVSRLWQRPEIDMTREPQTMFRTNPFQVGDSYTLGSMAVGPEVGSVPLTITAVEVVRSTGVDVLGVGAFDPDTTERGIGLVPGWPPDGPVLRDPRTEHVAWPNNVALVVGIKTLAAKSGLRGVVVRWVDGAGHVGSRAFDIAVLTCAPAACEMESDSSVPLLRELGLMQ